MTGSLASDGQTTATGNLKMGNNRITGLADGIASTDAATVNQVTTAGATYLLKASNLSDVANATTARGNLTAAKSGANSDITSITGLTTPLTVAQGGTGAATLTANNVLLGNGTSAPQVVAPSTAGNLLTSDGTTWASVANNGAAKAWVNFNGGSGNTAGVINASYNVSSITVGGTGDYTVNFTTALASANYCALCLPTGDSVNSDLLNNAVLAVTPTTSAARFFIFNSGAGALRNPALVSVAIHL
jgi:hypothetical protein